MLDYLRSGNHVDITAGYFGKLPMFADFVRYNAFGDEIMTINNWMQEGLILAKLKFGNDWKQYYNTMPKLNFVFPYTGTDNLTLGVVLPSSDKSGRSFPLIIFGNIKKAFLRDLPVFLLPTYFEIFYNSIHQVLDENNLDANLSRFQSELNQIKQENHEISRIYSNYRKIISEISLTNFIKLSCFGESYESDLTINDFLKKIKIVSDHSILVNFRINSKHDISKFITNFYIEFISKIFRKSDSFPVIFWTPKTNNLMFLFMFFQNPTPIDFVDLLYILSNKGANFDESSSTYIKFQNGSTVFNSDTRIDPEIKLAALLNSINKFLK